jgi:TonB family protein
MRRIVLAVFLIAVGVAVMFRSSSRRSYKGNVHAEDTIAIKTQPDPVSGIPFHPNGVATGLSVVPGAIVCQDLPTVHLVWELYINHWSDAMEDLTSQGSARILRGPSSPEPDPAQYGCSLLPAGTPLEFKHILPGIVHVTAKSANGNYIQGITQENMVVTSRRSESEAPTSEVSSEQQTQTSEPINESPEVQYGEHQGSAAVEEDQSAPLVPGKDGVSFPSCIYCPDPHYSPEAQAGKINGTVVLKVVIEPDGHPTNIQLVNGLGHGLDERAIRAVQSWRFKAAVGPDGRSVPTIVPIEINFRLN